jgi:WD40 repeat protein
VEERGQEQFLSTVDLAGRRIELARGIRAYSLAWSPNGEEIWFATGPLRNMNTIVAVTLSGRLRVLARLTGVVLLQDVSSDGRVLLTTGVYRHEVWCLPAGETKERDVGWLATSDAEALSADGKTILLNDLGEEGGGPGFSAFLRRTDGSPAFKVTDGLAEDLSPDTKWVACIRDGKALLLPTGAGEPRTLASPGFEYQGIEWFPDGRRLLVAGREQGRQKRLYLQDLSGGPPRPLSTEGITGPGRISPDGNLVVADQPDGFWIYPVSGGERRRLPEVRENEYVTCWSEDGRSVFVTIQGRLPYRIDRIDVATGRRELWRTIAPADPTAVQQADVLLKPNGSYALNVQRLLSDLYLVEGLK